MIALIRIGCVALGLLTAIRECPAADEPIVLGYYATHEGFDPQDIPWERLTHLCHAFLTTDADGRIAPSAQVPNKELTRLAASHGVPVILSVGGWGNADGFEAATLTDEKMSDWVRDATAIVVDNGYAGLDVDWEFPRDQSTKDRFTKLVRALRVAFDNAQQRAGAEQRAGRRLLLTSAVTARPEEGVWIDGPSLEPHIDFLNVMTYDFSGPFTAIASHHTPLTASPKDPEASWRSTEAAMRYWEQSQGFPRRKLNVGIPLYGRKFPLRTPYGATAGLEPKGFGTPEYKEIRRLIDSGWQVFLDPDTSTPWAVAPGNQLGLIAYDDVESAYRKGQWARAEHYRGIFFWAIGHDYLPDGRHHLIDSAVRGWSSDETGSAAERPGD